MNESFTAIIRVCASAYGVSYTVIGVTSNALASSPSRSHRSASTYSSIRLKTAPFGALLDATFRITVAFRQSHRLARAFIAPPSRETIAGTAKKQPGSSRSRSRSISKNQSSKNPQRIHWIAETGDDASTTRDRRAHAPARSASTTAANALAAAVDIARIGSVRFGSVRFVRSTERTAVQSRVAVVVVAAGTRPRLILLQHGLVTILRVYS
jgi:hypothetical protein